MTGTRPPRRRRLFVQMFAVMVGTLLATQLVSLTIVIIAPPPLPQAFGLVELADMLDAPATVPGELVQRTTQDPGFVMTTPRERRLAARLASRLGVPAADARLRLSDPPIAFGRRLLGKDGMGLARDALLVGDFEAALRRPDGRWQVVATSPKLLDDWQWRAIAWLLVTIVAISIPAFFMARRLADPIARFAAAAESLGRDPEAPLMRLEGPMEVEALAEAFAMMQQRLQRYVQDRTQMIGAIAHDLRTPLMRLAYHVENAPPEVRGPAQREIDEMNAMLGSVLGFVRDRLTAPDRQQVDLRSVVESVVEDHADAGASVSLVPGDAPIVHADLLALRRIFTNLVSNAVKFGDRAIVNISSDAHHTVILIDDDGAGLDDAELERVFEPFYRAETSRNRDTGGIGLGLAIVRTLARAHGGDVTLHNRDEGGLRAQVLLPI